MRSKLDRFEKLDRQFNAMFWAAGAFILVAGASTLAFVIWLAVTLLKHFGIV